MTDARRENNIGVLRLLFAALVVVAHSFELIDGNRTREPFSVLFHTISSGEFAVDGFFLLSGYLITKSAARRRSASDFLASRALRIYPGYAVAFLLSYFVVGWLGGGNVLGLTRLRHLVTIPGHIAVFDLPTLPGAFAGTPYALLNGSMWTIVYEVRCYLVALAVVALGGASGRNRRAVLVGTALLLCVAAVRPSVSLPALLERVVGQPADVGRFVGVFGVGALFYLYRERITYRGWAAALCGVLAAVLLRVPRLAEPALAVFGGYVLFWFALTRPTTWVSRVANETDISYGL